MGRQETAVRPGRCEASADDGLYDKYYVGCVEGAAYVHENGVDDGVWVVRRAQRARIKARSNSVLSRRTGEIMRKTHTGKILNADLWK